MQQQWERLFTGSIYVNIVVVLCGIHYVCVGCELKSTAILATLLPDVSQAKCCCEDYCTVVVSDNAYGS